MTREDDIRKIVAGGRQRGLSDDQIRALVQRYDQRQQEQQERALIDIDTDSLAGLRDKVASALPDLGAMAGSFIGRKKGGIAGPVAQAAGAAVGGGLGKGAELLMDSRDQSLGEGLQAMGAEAMKQGGLQIAGTGVSQAGRALYKGGAALLPKTLKQEFPDIAKTGFQEGISLTRRGANKAERLVGASADEADRLIAERAAARPRVAGLLPEGRTAVPLGAAPTPTGGSVSVTPATQMQPRKVGPVGSAEELLQRRWSPAYGGTPTGEAAADVVSGPGVVMRPLNAPPVPGRVPGMVALEDATAYVPSLTRDISTGALGSKEPGLRQVRKTVQLMRAGRQWPVSLPEAQALKRAEQDMAHRAYKAVDTGAKTQVPTRAKFAKAVAQGTREAIEREVPDVAGVNARTQSLMGVERAANHAANTGHILSRLGGLTGGALLGSGGGLLPAIAAAGTGAMLTTPGGLTTTGLALKRTGQIAPNSERLGEILFQLLADGND